MILELDSIHVFYGTSHALFGVTLAVAGGESVCLLGRNGSGKTTILSSIIGLIRPRHGSIKFMGEEISGNPPYQIARLGIGFVPEDRQIFSDLTVRENLQVPVAQNSKGWTIDDVYNIFPVLRNKDKQPGGTLSGGEQQMLAVGRALMVSPKLLLLDEPVEGLSPLVVKDLANAIGKLVVQGLTLFLSEQNVNFALSIAKRAYILEKGVVRYQGSVEELSQNEDVKKKYLTV
jgi:branched-chain amino acid transport system ATP-binding protein